MELQNCMTDMLSTLASGFGDKALMLVDKDGTPAGHILGTEMVGAMEYEHNKHNRVPWGYTELAYIETTGTQYIRTNIIPKVAKGTTVEIILAHMGLVSPEGSGANANLSMSTENGYWRFGNQTSNVPCVDGEFIAITKKQTPEGRYYSLAGDSGYASFLESDSNYCLGMLGGASYHMAARFKSCVITENDIKVLELVPAKRNSDNEVGMYDLVSNTFLTNAGTGTFSYGEL